MSQLICKRTTAVPKCLTVQIDTREKYPFQFPSNIHISDPDRNGSPRILPVKTESIKLITGDYRLKEFPECCVIERKGSPLEIYKNLFDPQDQFRTARAFRRLSTMEYPILLLEMTPFNLLSPVPNEMGISYNPEVLLHRLSLVIAKYGFNMIWTTKTNSIEHRRAVGTLLLHLMLGYAIREITNIPIEENIVPDRENDSDD